MQKIINHHLTSEPPIARAWGRLAVLASALCVLDCTVLPIVLLALTCGHWRHRDARATLLGSAGLALLLGAHHVGVHLLALPGSLMIFASRRTARVPSGACCAAHPVILRVPSS